MDSPQKKKKHTESQTMLQVVSEVHRLPEVHSWTLGSEPLVHSQPLALAGALAWLIPFRTKVVIYRLFFKRDKARDRI